MVNRSKYQRIVIDCSWVEDDMDPAMYFQVGKWDEQKERTRI